MGMFPGWRDQSLVDLQLDHPLPNVIKLVAQSQSCDENPWQWAGLLTLVY